MVTGFPKDEPGATKQHYIIPYTNPRALTWDDAAQTYMDEWSIYDVTDPRWENAAALGTLRSRESRAYNELSRIDFAIDPVNSYTDMAMYYHKKMLTDLRRRHLLGQLLPARRTATSSPVPAISGMTAKCILG